MFKTYTTLEEATHEQPRVTALLCCQENLMPLSWHMPVSKSPFRYAVAVRQENYTHTLLNTYGSFTLNFLPIEHYEVVNSLGKMHGNMENKLTQSKLKIACRDKNENSVLADSDFCYTCVVNETYENGDHTIFIADVTSIHVNEHQSHRAMLFSGRGRYATLGEAFRAEKATDYKY
ncbi:MAG: flavin reductase family protein [Campylobacterota bacterium]|nr:flavin reductase family protein [Campylobacterota bacterium]